MWLLPGAERERRALLLGAALAAGAAFSWWPLAPLDAACDRAVGWIAAPLVATAAWIERRVAPALAAAPAADAPAPDWLDGVERAAARPAPLPGFAWIEVPVVGIERRGAALRLGAGSRIGLADGMLAVCGDRYVGRLAEVGEARALVLHFRAADERTGVRLADADGTALDAILIGRGRQPPLLMMEGGRSPAAGAEVRFRGRPDDAPMLAAAGWVLGRCARFGDRARGQQAWVVEGELPPLAEGRVFVAAGALPAEPIAPILPAASPARLALGVDAVLGSRLRAFVSAEPWSDPPAVALQAGRVLGPVLRRRGGLFWTRADRPEDWIARGLALRPEGEAAAAGWFTRGHGGVPRGLWLGRAGEAPPRGGGATLLRAAVTREL